MRALIALLLTILFAQAVPAHEITLDRTRGSVFSAATVEVTLPPRKDDASLECIVAAPSPAKAVFQPCDVAPALRAQVDVHQHVWPMERARGPPLRPPPRSLAAPREPPHLS
tara:strand:- start:370 stop:705 length:336 start_codon:yes stop_codon:yes gene_type:complete